MNCPVQNTCFRRASCRHRQMAECCSLAKQLLIQNTNKLTSADYMQACSHTIACFACGRKTVADFSHRFSGVIAVSGPLCVDHTVCTCCGKSLDRGDFAVLLKPAAENHKKCSQLEHLYFDSLVMSKTLVC